MLNWSFSDANSVLTKINLHCGHFEWLLVLCNCRFRRRTCVELNSELIRSGMSRISGKCFKCRVFNMVDRDTEGTKDLKFARNYPLIEREGKGWHCSSLIFNMFKLHWNKNGQVSSFSLGEPNFTHAQYINIMYELDSTRQKFNVWIDITFLSDNATRPVERATEMRQPIQTWNFCQI